MKSTYSLIVMVALSIPSLGMIGQTEGCGAVTPFRIMFSDSSDALGSSAQVASSSGSDATWTEMRAVLTGPGEEHGDAVYRERGARRQLDVELEDAEPGSTHTIVVDGIDIGALTIGALCKGEVEFDTEIEPGHVPWPTQFQMDLAEGAIITVGSTSGTLAPTAAGDDDEDDGDDDGLDDTGDDGIRMNAELLSAGVEHGDADYREVGTRLRLKVELEDATPGSVHMILVDGLAIGELTIGSLGEGEVEFDTRIEPGHVEWPADFPDGLDTGAIIDVGPAAGALGGA